MPGALKGRCLEFRAVGPIGRLGRAMASRAESGAVSSSGWVPLQVPKEELFLSHTLPVGQTFRWVETGEGAYTGEETGFPRIKKKKKETATEVDLLTKRSFPSSLSNRNTAGVIGTRAYQIEQLEDSIRYRVVARGDGSDAAAGSSNAEEDAAALREYFQLHLNLSELIDHWSKCDERFKAVKEYYPGARLLRQDPVECLFSFVCSSNNNIARIHGMVHNLCRLYGTQLGTSIAGETKETSKLYAFPTLEQLSEASEDVLRSNGFGYRAKFITGTVSALNSKPGGGAQWLLSLRQLPYEEASMALQELPGVGPKVAACVALFSLDKQEAIPVDVHVWRLVKEHYRKDLQEKKSITPRLMKVAQDELIKVFGSKAGWAHNVLFLAELAQLKKVNLLSSVVFFGGGSLSYLFLLLFFPSCRGCPRSCRRQRRRRRGGRRSRTLEITIFSHKALPTCPLCLAQVALEGRIKWV